MCYNQYKSLRSKNLERRSRRSSHGGCKVALMLILLAFYSVGLAADGPSADLRIFAAHYAERGHRRFANTGYGAFLGYSFGRTNTCVKTSFEENEGQCKNLCVTNVIVSGYREFDSVKLYHDVKSRRLFKVLISRKLPVRMSISECIDFFESVSEDCDYWYAIKLPIPLSADIETIKKKHNGVWSVERGDEAFSIRFSLEMAESNIMKATMAVESKRVRKPRSGESNVKTDIKVYADDL